MHLTAPKNFKFFKKYFQNVRNFAKIMEKNCNTSGVTEKQQRKMPLQKIELYSWKAQFLEISTCLINALKIMIIRKATL